MKAGFLSILFITESLTHIYLVCYLIYYYLLNKYLFYKSNWEF